MIILTDIESLGYSPCRHTGMSTTRSRGFVVKWPIYDASNDDHTIDLHHVNTTILTDLWLFHEIYYFKQVK